MYDGTNGSPLSPSQALRNWAGNYVFTARCCHIPETVPEIQGIVKQARSVKVLGTRHSSNSIGDCSDTIIRSDKLNRILSLDTDTMTVTVEGGVQYGEVAKYLHERGFALHNLPSTCNMTVAGAIQTGTHGSGAGNMGLASGVATLEVVNGHGEVELLSRENIEEEFSGAVVALGSLGVITKVGLKVVPAFEMQQVVYTNLSMEALKEHSMEILTCAYSVSLFTKYRNSEFHQVWIKHEVGTEGSKDFPNELFGAKLATEKRHPDDINDPLNCTEQLGTVGPWLDRLPHFIIDAPASAGNELQSEYFVPIESVYQAAVAVDSLSDKIKPHLFVSEIRTVKGDDLWMSPCYQRNSASIHFTWKPHGDAVKALAKEIEAVLAPFDPRPHWAKVFAMEAKLLQGKYERLDDFKKLMTKYDPERKFRNEFVTRHLYS